MFYDRLQLLDYKVADLHKKLNKLKFSATSKTEKLNSLMKEYEKVVRLNAEMVRCSLQSVNDLAYLSQL